MAATRPKAALEQAERRKYFTYGDGPARHQVHFVPFIMDEYGHIGPMGVAFLQGLAERTATKRRANGTTTEVWAVLAQRLQKTWQGFMIVELHSAMARVVEMLAQRAVQGLRE